LQDTNPQQAAAFAFRRTRGATEICLIRKKDSETWGIPKGLVDPGDTLEETTLQESWEEAGPRGRLTGESIGCSEYEKWGSRFRVAVFLLEVVQEEEDWEEASVRERRWSSLDAAFARLASHTVHPLLDRARAVLGQPV